MSGVDSILPERRATKLSDVKKLEAKEAAKKGKGRKR
jgi:hypothetical protein